LILRQTGTGQSDIVIASPAERGVAIQARGTLRDLLLQTQGRSSSRAFQRILVLSADRPLLREALQGHFLDVGTGVAGIALEVARCCPSLLVDGIDIWAPALALARENVKDSSFADRITIKNLDVTGVPEGPVYTLAWLPTMFMKRAVVEAAIDRIAATLKENSYLVAACYTMPAEPDAAAFVTLRTLRSGGEPIAQSEMEDMLRVRGFIDIESDASALATFTLGRLP
jgi:precorrin-6B methylase 2